MAEEKQDPPKRRGSCLGKLVTLLTFAGVAGLGVAVWFIAQPQDLSDLKKVTVDPNVRPVLDKRLKEALADPERYKNGLTVTEEDINLYLKQTLSAKQGGLLGEWVKLEDVRVRLEKDRAELILVRSIMGRPMTLSMYFRVVQTAEVNDTSTTHIIRDGGTFFPQVPDTLLAEKVVKGGRFGQLVVPQGFLILILPSINKLADAYHSELHDGFEEMVRIQIEEGKLVLDPRPGGSALPRAGESF